MPKIGLIRSFPNGDKSGTVTRYECQVCKAFLKTPRLHNCRYQQSWTGNSNC